MYDSNLICPIVLASKAVLFNWKDSLQKDKLLNMLGIVARAAESVAPEEDEDGDGVGVSGAFFFWRYRLCKNEGLVDCWNQSRSAVH